VILFGILALLALVFAVFMVATRNAVHSALFLIGNFVILAILYITLGAEFLGLAQILVYAGAVMVLFLFVIAYLSAGTEASETGPALAWQLPLGIAAGVLSLGLLLWGTLGAVLTPTAAPPHFGSLAFLGRALFTTYLFPFEITAFLLLAALVGVVVLVRDER
jgi:NADH-quinone oxidoreductase subunit J